MSLRVPEPLADHHHLDAFSCGKDELDQWLKARARRNEAAGHSRTYVLTEAGDDRVIGYYALAAGALARSGAPKRFQRNAPDPIPVIILARLAVDAAFRDRHSGTGRWLLKDALLRAAASADIVAARGVSVQALDEEAARFYRHFGFVASPSDPLALFLGIGTIRAALPPAR